MTEAETPTSWPELGTKSPEKPKPRSAPREKKADNRNKDRKDDNKKDAAPRDKNTPPDNGEPLIKPATVQEPNHEQQEKHDQKLRDEIDADEKKVVSQRPSTIRSEAARRMPSGSHFHAMRPTHHIPHTIPHQQVTFRLQKHVLHPAGFKFLHMTSPCI
jgi:hypothetical protein